jgi:hypothetical protein
MANSHADVAHAWANKTKDSMRGSRMYFDGARIYSYGSHFTIAEHVTNKAGAEAVLLTERTYSSSTSGHVARVRRAASHLNLIHVPSLDSGRSARDFFRVWMSEAESLYKSFHAANVSGKGRYSNAMLSLESRVSAYTEFFGERVPEDLAELLALAHNQTWIEARRESERRAEEREANRSAAQAERARRAEERRARIFPEQLEKFRAGEISYISARNGFDYLRYNAEARRIETSQSVQIPRTAARRMYYWLLTARDSGGCAPCNYKITGFTVREVSADMLRVGCHNIPFSEVEAIAARLGWNTLTEAEAEKREEPSTNGQPSASI